MPIDFPQNPVLDQEFIVSRDRSYTYDGEKWRFASPSLTVINVTALDPIVVGVADPPFTLSVIGTGFTPSAEIRWDDQALATTFVSDTLLTCQIDPATTGPADAHYVRVHDGTGVSVAVWFSVIEHPALGSLDPDTSGGRLGDAAALVLRYLLQFRLAVSRDDVFDGVADPTSTLGANTMISTEYTAPATPGHGRGQVWCGRLNR